MHRYFIELAYDGTAYHGWQVQPHDVSVQEVLTHCLSTLMGRDTEIVGAGRTDAGVHARLMVAHFDSPVEVDCAWLTDKLNRMLPQDISVFGVRPVVADAHARFSATYRTYHYFVHHAKNPFNREYSYRVPGKALDYEQMNQAAKLLFDYVDFTSFSKVHTDVKTNNCKIMRAEWVQLHDDEWMFVIQADRFLRNMVRAIVGTLVEVGRGKLSLEGFRRVIEQKDRCSAGTSMPGNALFLVDIGYNKEIYLV